MVTQKSDHISNCSYFIWSKAGVLHFVTIKHSLHWCGKTILHKNDDSPVIHRFRLWLIYVLFVLDFIEVE